MNNNTEWILKQYFIDYDDETKNWIYFDTAINFLYKKHGKKHGDMISRQKTFWEWYRRIVDTIDKRLNELCIQNECGRALTMELYEDTLRNRLMDFDLNKAVTDIPFKSERLRSKDLLKTI